MSANVAYTPARKDGLDMPDVGTPQATWHADPIVQEWAGIGFAAAMEAAVAVRDREVSALLRPNIEALWDETDDPAYNLGFRTAVHHALTVLDAVFGGDQRKIHAD